MSCYYCPTRNAAHLVLRFQARAICEHIWDVRTQVRIEGVQIIMGFEQFFTMFVQRWRGWDPLPCFIVAGLSSTAGMLLRLVCVHSRKDIPYLVAHRICNLCFHLLIDTCCGLL